jgi:hypothetical protein
MIHLYADEYKGKVVLGYTAQKHAGYMVYQNGYEVMGVYYLAGYLNGPQAYYCPSKLDVRWKYNTPENPWPPPPPSNILCRLGMTLRPSMRFGATISGKYDGTIPSSYQSGTTVTDDGQDYRHGYPTLSNLRKRAIGAEMFGEPTNTTNYVDPRLTNHKNVINVVFDDGSATPVDINAKETTPNGDGLSIYDILGNIANLKAVPTGTQMDDWYLNENKDPNWGIWHKFDLTRP